MSAHVVVGSVYWAHLPRKRRPELVEVLSIEGAHAWARRIDTGRRVMVECKRLEDKRPKPVPRGDSRTVTAASTAKGVTYVRRKPARSGPYLDHVRAHPCMRCAAPPPSHAHHEGPRGMGQKTDDFRTVPLCAECHDTYHRGGVDDVGSFRDEMRDRMLDLLIAYLRKD